MDELLMTTVATVVVWSVDHARVSVEHATGDRAVTSVHQILHSQILSKITVSVA
jgi:hypothetical protein